MYRARNWTIWATVALLGIWPIAIAAMSPLLEWRQWVYVTAGLGGVVALSMLLLQPLLAVGLLPGITIRRGRHVHRWIGGVLVLSITIHVVGLWITSPPDVIDALLFVSATPFSVWGVIAMWSIIITAALAMFRRKLKLRLQVWRYSHKILASVTVAGSVAHALMIEGTMGTVSKTVLCILLVIATAIAVLPRLSAFVIARKLV